MNLNMSIICIHTVNHAGGSLHKIQHLERSSFGAFRILAIISCQETKHNLNGIQFKYTSRDYCNECLQMFATFTIQSLIPRCCMCLHARGISLCMSVFCSRLIGALCCIDLYSIVWDLATSQV